MTEPCLRRCRRSAGGEWRLGTRNRCLVLEALRLGRQSGVMRRAILPPLSLLDRIDLPDALSATPATDLHDEDTKTDLFNREETDESLSALARMLFSIPPITCYRSNRGLGPALRTEDIAMTFRVVSDSRSGASSDTIAKRTLQLDRVNFQPVVGSMDIMTIISIGMWQESFASRGPRSMMEPAMKPVPKSGA